MRRLPLALAALLLLIAAPIAGAKSFEATTVKGELVFRSSAGGESMITIASIAPKTLITGPRSLQGIACVDGEALKSCVSLKRGKKTATWTVLKPVRLAHQQAGGYTITLKKAGDLRDVFISGCGQVRLVGSGSYSADGTEPVSYTASDTTVVIDLKP